MSLYDGYYDEAYSREEDPYETVRAVLKPQYQHISSGEVETLLESVGLDANDMEFSLSNALSSVGSFVKSAAPAILPVAGTVVGTAFGGPVGGAVGGTLGKMAGGAIGGVPRPAPGLAAVGHPPVPKPVAFQPAAPQPVPIASVAGLAAPLITAAGSGSPSASQLLQILSRPETLQALLAMALGMAGKEQIPIGSTQVPLGAFTNAIETLASQAASEYNASNDWQGESIPSYLLDSNGYFLVDPAMPEGRAARLIELLDEAASQELVEISPFEEDWEEGIDWEEDENAFYSEDDD